MTVGIANKVRGGARASLLGLLLVFVGVVFGIFDLSRRDRLAADSPPERVARAPSQAAEQAELAPEPAAASGAAGEAPPAPANANAPVTAGGDREPGPDEDGRAAGREAFTVSVAPLVLETDDARARQAFAFVYERLLEALRAEPRLALAAPEAADFRLEITAETGDEPLPQWLLRVSWSARTGGRGSWLASGEESVPREADRIAPEAVAALRRYPFPPEPTRTAVLESIVLNSALPYEERFDAIDELTGIPERFAFVGRDETRLVSVAAANMVGNSPDPEIRGRVWKAMIDHEDPYLIGPLFDSMLTDASDYVRLEAIKALASNYGDDSRAMAALEYAVLNDLSPQVRAYALWEALDDQGRWDYVADTLLNTDLSDSERLELVMADVRGFENYVDRQSVQALLAFVGPARPSLGQLTSLDEAANANASLVIPALLGILNEHANADIRATVATALSRHLDAAGVRTALEVAAREDASARVRAVIEFALREAADDNAAD